MHIYYPSNAVIYSRSVTGISNVTEQYIGIQPDTVFVLSGSSLLSSSLSASYASSSLSASYALTASYAPSTPSVSASYASSSTSASYALSASYAPSSGNNATASYAGTASYLVGYRDTNRVVDQSWEFLSSHTSTDSIFDGWNIINGTVTSVNSELGHPGIVRRNTNVTQNLPNSFTPSISTAVAGIALGDFRSFEVILRPAVTSAYDHVVRIGLFTDMAGLTQSKGFYFERTGSAGISASWQLTSMSGSIMQTTGSPVTYGTGAGDWHNFKLLRDNVTNKISYIIDDIFYTTSSYNLPLDTGFVFGVQIYPTIAAQRSFDIDYARITSYPITSSGR